MFIDFAKKHSLEVELCQHQNFYPDLTFVHAESGNKFAVDIKSTYRQNETKVNGMTLGAFTGYFRNRESNKNTLYPYNQYAAHIVLGVIYSKCSDVADESKLFSLSDLSSIPSVIKGFQFFAQPKFRIAAATPGSGNTKNIGSVDSIVSLLNGSGPFLSLGEDVYDDYWMYYLTQGMASELKIPRPYMNLKTYSAYKLRGNEILKANADVIASLNEEEEPKE